MSKDHYALSYEQHDNILWLIMLDNYELLLTALMIFGIYHLNRAKKKLKQLRE